MKRNNKMVKFLLLCMALIMLFSACTDSGKKTNSSSETDEIALSDYPVKTDKELTYWVKLNANVATSATELGKTEFAKELEKRTGIKVKYVHPTIGQEGEALSLMVASNELPDIIEHDWNNALGGPSSAINDKIIIPLNDVISKYAVNLSSYLEKNPDIDRMVKTDEGQYYVFPFIRADKSLAIPSGPIVRKDWLEELGLEEPETIEDWENMLIAFRDKKGATAPLTISGTKYLFYIMNSTCDFYVENGKIKYGPAEPEYKEAITTLNRWFENGLLDKNYISTDKNMQDSNILNGKSGATYGAGGNGLGRWMSSMKGKDDKYNLVGVKYPVFSEDKPARFGPYELPFTSICSASITTACKEPALAAKFLDYAYSEEGHILFNFGIEGESFEYKDGYPTYTENITNNQEGLTMNQSMAIYMRSHFGGPYINDKRYLEQYWAMPQQKDALSAWLSSYDESVAALVPPITMTPEENQEFANVYNEIQTYRDTMTASFISGIEPLSKYDEFVKHMDKLGLDKAIKLKQQAYDRYKKR